MHRSTYSNHANGGGLFKGGNIFGGSKTPTPATSASTTSSTRPSTSSGSPSTHKESIFSSTNSRTPTFSRKTSVSAASSKSPKAAPHKSRNNSTAIPTLSPEKRVHTYKSNHPLPATASVPARAQIEAGPKSADSAKPLLAEGIKTPVSGTESQSSTAPYSNMLARPGTGYQSINSNGGQAQSSFGPMQPPSPTLETITYQHIQETSSKRISTLDYLRKAYVRISSFPGVYTD